MIRLLIAFLVEPMSMFIGKAIETKAIGRAYRLGQSSRVTVVR